MRPLLLLLLLLVPAFAQDVDTLIEQGTARAEARDYAGALKLFEQGKGPYTGCSAACP